MSTFAKPTVGQFATYSIGSDRYIVEVVKVSPTGKTISVRDVRMLSTGNNSQWEPNENGEVTRATLDRSSTKDFYRMPNRAGTVRTNRPPEFYRDPSF